MRHAEIIPLDTSNISLKICIFARNKFLNSPICHLLQKK